MLNYLQMAVGYSITGHTVEEKLFYLYGPTRSGKGTFMETLLALMFSQAQCRHDLALHKKYTSLRITPTRRCYSSVGDSHFGKDLLE